MLDAGQALGLILYVAIVVGILHLLVAVIRWTLGSEKWRNHALWGFVLLVVGSGGLGVVSWLYEGASPSLGGEFIVIPSSGTINASKYFPVDVRVIPLYLGGEYSTYYVRVDWGDGTVRDYYPREEGCRAYLTPLTVSHQYWSDGPRSVKVFIFKVKSEQTDEGCEDYAEDLALERTFMVNVTSPWSQYAAIIREAFNSVEGNGTLESVIAWGIRAAGSAFASLFETISDFTARQAAAHGFNPGEAMYFLVAMPTSDNFPAMRKVYNAAAELGWLIIAFAALLGLIARGLFHYEEGASPLVDWLLKSVLVAAGIVASLMIYDAAAKAWNLVTLSLARLGQLGSLYMMVLGAAFTSTILGAVSPSAGSIGAGLLLVILAVIVIGLLKWLLAGAITVILPVLLPAYLVGGLFEGAVRRLLSLLVGLFIWSLVSAALSALAVEAALTLTQTGTGKNLIFAASLPIVVAVAGHMVSSTIAPGALPGSFLAYRLLGGRGATPIAAAGAAVAPAMAGIMLPRTPPPYPPTTVPGPAGAPAGYAAPVALSGAVVGTVPTPTAGPVRGNIGYVHTGPPMIGPSPAGLGRQEKPREITSLTPPGATTRRQRAAGVIRTLHEMATGKAKPAEQAPRRVKAAYYAARATSKLASHVKRNITEFDRVLQRELGISLIEKPVTKRIAPTARYTYQAAKWVAPRIRSGAPKLARMISEKLPVRKAMVRETREGSYEEA